MRNNDESSSAHALSPAQVQLLFDRIAALEQAQAENNQLLSRAHAIATPSEHEKFAFLPWRKSKGSSNHGNEEAADEDEAQESSS